MPQQTVLVSGQNQIMSKTSISASYDGDAYDSQEEYWCDSYIDWDDYAVTATGGGHGRRNNRGGAGGSNRRRVGGKSSPFSSKHVRRQISIRNR